MKQTLVIYFLLLLAVANGQTTDDFSDGDLSLNPTWIGDLQSFTTENMRLRSNSNTANDVFYLGTMAPTGIEAQWELKVELLFSTSSKNYIQFVIQCDSQNIVNSTNAYYVEIGGTKDRVAFYHKENGSLKELIASADASISGGSSRTSLKVVRSSDSVFSLWVDYSGGVNYTFIGSVKNGDIGQSNYSGIIIEQSTSSFFTKHYFDDFYAGPIVLDTKAPELIGVKQLDLQTLELEFNEELDSLSAVNTAHYTVNKGVGNPSQVALVDPLIKKKIRLSFLSPLGNPENYTLHIEKVSDAAFNVLDTLVSFQSIEPVIAAPYGLLITELLASPEPQVGLPGGEFVELYNSGKEPIDLGDYVIADLSTEKSLPSQILMSGEYVIICEFDDSLAYANFGKVLAISALPSLNNDRDRLRVLNSSGDVIHEVNYLTSVLPEEKKNGWSLEMVDETNPCQFHGNWKASESFLGGTPGKENSVKGTYPDLAKPMVQRIYPISNNKVELFFNEPIVSKSLVEPGNYFLLEENTNPNLVRKTDSLNKVLMEFPFEFTTGEVYKLEVRNAEDCVGNAMELDTLYFGLPKNIVAGDLLFNEILYEPFTGGEEFIEIVNTTDSFLDLKQVKIAVREDGVFSKVEYLSGTGYLVAPHAFVVLCSDKEGVLSYYQNYDSTVIYETNGLPTLPNDGLELVLLNIQNIEIDALNYSPKWHYEVIDDSKGVSLERISLAAANHSNNWTSASMTSGFATPGLKNSQSATASESLGTINLKYKSFSPNQDGFRDVLILEYAMDQPNTTANVYVFNEQGALVNQIAKNHTLSREGLLTWKGETMEGNQAQMGIYVILFEYFLPNGKVERKKISCALVLE